MYIKHCKLTNYQQLRLMEYFVAGTPARTAADLVGVHRNSAVRFFHKLRGAIALKQQKRGAQFCGKIEVDESYFGGRRKGKRGRGAAGKVIVFGLLKRGGKVYTMTVDDVKRDTLIPAIRQKVRGLTALCTPTAIRLIMHWTCPNLNITASITAQNLLTGITILTALRISGIRPKDTCGNTTESRGRILICS